MRITLSIPEALELKKVVTSLKLASVKLDFATGGMTNAVEEDESLETFFNECPFATVKAGLFGVTVEIKPEFISDVCFIYKQYIEGTVEHIIPLVKALIKANEITEHVMNKWVTRLPDQQIG